MKNVIQFLIFAIIFLSIIICFLTLINNLTKNNIKKDSYNGIIQKIYEDKNNHYSIVFWVKTADRSFNEISESFPYSWKYATVGDSIIKEKGELYIRIKKKNGDSKIFYFDP